MNGGSDCDVPQTSAFVSEGERGTSHPEQSGINTPCRLYVVPERIMAVPSPRRGDGGVSPPPSGSFTSDS